MIRIRSITLGAVLATLVTGEAAAQWNVARFSTARKNVYTTFGLDPALVTTVGIANVGTLIGRDVQLSGDVGMVTASADTRDFRARLGMKTSLVRWRSVSLVGSATAITRGTDNSIYRGYNFGADFTAALGVYRPRWFAAADFGKDKAVITKVTFSDWYRANGYAGAKDGWYLDAGGTLHHGIAAGVAVRRAEIVTRLGWLRSEDFNSLMPPVYATVGLGFGL